MTYFLHKSLTSENPPLASLQRAMWQLFSCLLLATFGLLATSAQAGTTDGALRMEVITAYNFVVDSNIESPSGKSPSAAHLGVKIYNVGPTALTNVVVNIGDLTNPSTSSGTPGTFESRTVNEIGQYAGTFALQMPGGAADAVRVIPRIEPGESVVQYFFVTYPLKDSLGRSVTGSAPVVTDDLWLNYDIWAYATEGASTRRVEQTTKVTMRNEISAMANKIWPNGDNKVPEQYLSIIESFLGWRPSESEPRIPGAELKEGIWYDLGNVGAGFDNNDDGIPDRNAWLQPVGDPSQFNPLGARMVKCYGIVIVKLNDGTEQLIPFEDQLYFENLPANNTGAVGLVYYEFLPLNSSLPTRLTPYQEVASGYDNEKFNGDYGTVTGAAAILSPQAEIVKTGDATRQIGQNTAYTLTATNTGTVQFGWPDLGLPVLIEDPIPAGLQYVAGSAVSGPNVTNPAGGVFNVFYSTNNGTSWTSNEPVPSSTVNRLRWVLDRPLQQGDTATVKFSATVPTGFSGASFSNTAILKTGTETEVDRDDWTTTVSGINSIGNFVWRDLNRNGAQDDGATGIPNIGVSLYVDTDGDGTLDSGEPLYGTTSTDTNGAYLFSSLPDRKYIVVVNATDPDLFSNYTLKAGVSDRFAVDLDATSVNASPVNFLTADWPFIEALEVTKTVSPTSYLGGELITYNIHLDNHMNTLTLPQPNSQTVYATSTVFDKTNAAAKTTEAQASGAPNSLFTFIDWNANSDRLVSTGVTPSFTLPAGAGITKVELILRGYQSAPLSNDQLDIEIGHSDRTITTFVTRTTAQMNALVGVSQDLVIDVTSAAGVTPGWTAAEINSLRAALTANKTQGGDTGDYNVDSIGFRITTNNIPFSGSYGPNTIVEWPLKDTYDPNKLEFVTASALPDVTSPAGTLEWFNLGPVNAGARKTITVTFRAKIPTDTNADGRRDAMVANNYVTTEGVSDGHVPTFASGLPAGHDDSTVNVTINPAGRIGDFVYWDVNSNYVYDVDTDFPLRRIIVQLFRNNGTSFVYTGRSEFTDVNGYYEFTGLTDGTYRVHITTDTLSDLFSLPWTTFTSYQKASITPLTTAINGTGFVFGDSVVINNADTVTTNDFNFLQDFGFDSNAGSLISGNLFRDWNGNGIQDPGDEPLVGFTVTLTGANSGTVTTDSNGFYQFINLTNTGNSTVTVTSPPASHTQTRDPDSTFNSATTVNVALGAAYMGRNFAYKPTGTITLGDTVYYDWNKNGIQNAGEGGIPNIEVRLYEDSNADGIIQSATDAYISSVNTSSTGFYQFTNLAAGNYIVEVVVTDPEFPQNFVETQDFDGLFDNNAKVNLVASISTVDFGFAPIGIASIGNQVWYDSNDNGIKDVSEGGINGVTVQLYRSDQTPGVDTPYASTITSGDGLYNFTELPDGVWQLYIPVSNFTGGGALVLYPNSSSQTVVLDNQADNDDNGSQPGYSGTAVTSPLITLSIGESEQTLDFGFTGEGSIGDIVFYDLNGNGNLDYNETGINGVIMELYVDANNDGNADGAFIATTTTATVGGISGYYVFSDLAPNTYIVKVRSNTLPAGVTQTADPDLDGIPVNNTDLDDENDGDHADKSIVLFSGSNYSGADFGYQPPGAIGDYVWLDVNSDGVQDPGEPGISGVVIRITNGITTYDVTTDYDGYWAKAVADGNWTVSVLTPPADRVSTYDADSGTTLPDASVAITVSGGIVTVPSGLPQGNLGLDFGYALDGDYSLAGTVAINDTRVSGKHDDLDDFIDDGTDSDAGPNDETELSGVLVYLYSSSGSFLGSMFTDAGGNYLFPNLPNGEYRVIIGTTAIPLDRATLTTSNSNYTDGTTVVDTGTSVRQNVEIDGASLKDIDFMFVSDVDYDFGDLPTSYAITGLLQNGARHVIPDGGATLYLGTAPDAEKNGTPSLLANSDDIGQDDEDGVTFNTSGWANGTGGGSATVAVTGSGWLVAWIDWNRDGDLLDAGEMIIDGAVSTGSAARLFDIPVNLTLNGAQVPFDISGNQSWYSRFRLFPSRPEFSAIAYIGEASGGEVEDYLVEKTSGGSIGDLVWADLDGDGMLDTGETGIAGVVVQLRDSDNQPITSQTTSNGTQDVDGDGIIDPVGYYRFRDLAAATYNLVISSAPAGYSATYDENSGNSSPDGATQVILAANQQHLTADFGYEPSIVNISGQVRYDLDGDGNPLDADTPAAFVRIQLWTDPNGDGDPDDGVQVGETYTGLDGRYSFANVTTGKYVVLQTNIAGATSTYDVQGSPTDDRIAVQVVATDVTGRDFLDALPSLYAISGSVYGDTANDDVIGTGDALLPGVNVSLYYDRDANGSYTPGTDTLVGSALTNLSGAYSFAGLPPGQYFVVETVPSGTTAIYDVEGAPTDGIISVALVSSNVTNRNFLLDVTAVYSISGTAYNDTTNSSVIDNPGDAPLTGVVVQLRDGSGNLVDSVVTNSSGAYSFPNLIPGNYRVTTINPVELDAVTDRDGNANGPSQIDVTIAAASVVERDFLLATTTLKIAGEIFDDRDFDNQFTSPPDTLRSGMRVSLYRDADGDGIADPSEYIEFFITGTDGSYEFDGLAPGAYLVKLTPAQRCRFVNERGEPTENIGSLTDGQMTVSLVDADNLDNDFLLCRGIFLGAIGDRVWLDENSNGIQDPGEAGIANVTVRLYDATGVFVISETITDTDGYYLFPNRSAQTYVVRVDPTTMPSGLSANATYDIDGLSSLHNATVVLPGDTLNRKVDFGYNWAPTTDVVGGSNTGAIGNRLWIDADGDGVQDLGEAGLVGVPVRLFYDSNSDGTINALYASTVTAADGSYIFDGLPAGIYKVIVNNGVTPSGYVQTGDPDYFAETLPSGQRDNATTTPIVLGPGDVFVNADFGYQLLSGARAVSGTIYFDYDGDGVDDGAGDPGVRFVTVALLDSNGVVLARTMTNEQGAYTFPGLPTGTYTVWVNDTYRQLGGRRITDDPDAELNAYHTIYLNGSDGTGIDFGYAASEQRIGFGMVHGTVFLDRDSADDLDVGESLRGVRVYLYDSTGTTRLDDTQTDANGEYFFGGVAEGTYIVRVDTTTLPSGGTGLTNNVDPDMDLDSEFTVVLAEAGISASLNFGYEAVIPRTISGTIWEDANANGTLDPAEADRIEGVVMVLFDTAGNELGWTYTDSNGAYSFTGLPAGNYVLDIVEVGKMLYGYWSSYGTPEVEGQSQTVNHSVTLNGGNEIADFGLYLQPSSLGDFVWWDQDQDGVQDVGETGIAGVSVELLITWPNSGGTTRIVQITDSSGNYSFGNLLLDEHQNGDGTGEPVFALSVQTEPGTASPIESGSATDATDSNDPSETTTTVLQGESNLTTDFGFYSLYGSIAGTVRKDTTGNGAGDVPHASVTVELLDGSGNPIDTTTTAFDGTYLFTNVEPGNYKIRQSVPSGYIAIDDVDDGDYTLIGDVTSISQSNAQNLTGQDFVNTQLGSIAGFVLADTDDNNTGDAPIPGVTLELYSGETLIATVTSQVDGSYLFTNVSPGTYTVRETQPSDFTSVSDMDGGNLDINGDVTPITVLPGQAITGRNFVEEQYGLITGSVLADTNNDGAGNLALVGVTLSLVYSNGDPVLNGSSQPITTVTDEDGFYSFTNLSPGTYGVIQMQPSGYVSLSDKDGGNLNEILPILVEAGITNPENDFIEISSCPDTWADWKQLHPSESAGGNPDGDDYANFTEFAFAMPYDSGTGSEWLDHTAWIVQESAIAPGTVEGVFIRPTGADLNVVYTLQHAAVIGSPTTSWTTIAIPPGSITITPNPGDCTETVRIHNLAAITGLPNNGVVRLKADLYDAGYNQDENDVLTLTTYTETEGWTITNFAVCCHSYNNPYARESVFTGTISAVSGQQISFSGEQLLGNILEVGASYYIEVGTGTHEGHRYDVASTSAGSLTLASDNDLYAATAPFNTTTTAPPETLVGAKIALRRHWKLAEMFPPLDHVATGSQATADQIQIFVQGAWKIYWLYNQNDVDPATAIWVDAADLEMDDQGAVIIPPGQGMLFNNRGVARTQLSYGEIRLNDFIRPLPIGRSFVGGGYPLDQSAAGARGRQMTKAVGFFGSRDFTTADSFFLWNADTVLNGRSYSTYFLHDASPRIPALIRWVVVGDNVIQSRDAEVHFKADRAVFIRTKNGLPTYTIPSPWAP